MRFWNHTQHTSKTHVRPRRGIIINELGGHASERVQSQIDFEFVIYFRLRSHIRRDAWTRLRRVRARTRSRRAYTHTHTRYMRYAHRTSASCARLRESDVNFEWHPRWLTCGTRILIIDVRVVRCSRTLACINLAPNKTFVYLNVDVDAARSTNTHKHTHIKRGAVERMRVMSVNYDVHRNVYTHSKGARRNRRLFIFKTHINH